jgi:hypothetical protein
MALIDYPCVMLSTHITCSAILCLLDRPAIQMEPSEPLHSGTRSRPIPYTLHSGTRSHPTPYTLHSGTRSHRDSKDPRSPAPLGVEHAERCRSLRAAGAVQHAGSLGAGRDGEPPRVQGQRRRLQAAPEGADKEHPDLLRCNLEGWRGLGRCPVAQLPLADTNTSSGQGQHTAA